MPKKFNWEFWFDIFLVFSLSLALVFSLFSGIPKNITINLSVIFSVIGVFPVLISAVRALWKKKLTIDLLASIALLFAFFAQEWFSAAFINLMLAFARIFDNWTQNRARNIIERLLKYRPEKVKVERESKVLEIPLEKVKVGDLVVVEAGERVAADGVVVSGQASINQATLTGESEPVSKTVGDQVFSSTLNEAGSLLVKAEKVGEDTTLAKIITLISEASRAKPKNERIADKFTTWYILLSLFGSLALYIFLKDLNLVLAILLVTCADDIAVAIPLSFTTAIARAAGRGIIIKGADIVENLKNLDIFITDKTGTLTFGKPEVKQIITFNNFPEKDFMELIGMAEINSHHPAGRSIVQFVKKKNIKIGIPDEFHEIPGEGIEVVKDNQKYLAGKIAFFDKNNYKIAQKKLDAIEEVKSKGQSITALGFNGELLGFMVLEDKLRPSVKQSILKTKALGVKSWIMLTGDNEKVGTKVAEELGIKEFRANMTPQAKVDFIKELRKNKTGRIAMVGDGVNDAAAMALADVSFSMGAIGSDAAIEASDIALMNDELDRIPEALTLSRKTIKTVDQNFLIWGLTNAAGLALIFLSILGPSGASAYNFVTDFLPIFNALRIFKVRLT